MEPMDAFEYAAKNAEKGCPKCHGTGRFMYNHNRGTICDLCCQHGMGWWQLSEHHSHLGKWCCGAGCGKVLDERPDIRSEE